MATKCITISNEAYERLAAFKESKESFSDVIKKLTSKHTLVDLVGLLTNKEAEELELIKKETNKRVRKEVEKVASQIQ
mgnify:FL=1